MKKLLLLLLLVFLTSPAMAHSGSTVNMTLEHGKSYTKSNISCSTKDDIMKHIHDINQLQEGQFTRDNVMATITNNNCVYQLQHFTYINEEYVCSFSIRNRNFTLLDTEVEGIKLYIVVNAQIDNSRILHCIQERQPN